jgi:nascent polypeptide-associated complex subunit alpha|tara:strand:+ start:49 stop:378 length:330 start_codon:yes stop_codon:yes gene_type:complete
MDNRQNRRMLEKMGINLEEVPDVEEVIIKTKEKELVLKKVNVSKIKAKDTEMFQIVAEEIEEIIKENKEINEKDIHLVSQQAKVSLETAKIALEESDGDLAQAILKLTS